MYGCLFLHIHYINILQSVTIMKKIFSSFLFFFIFFLMLAFPSITKNAANQGIQLWIFTVMPALLPYTIISSLLLSLNVFKFPCQIFTAISGSLCGCPIGAKMAADYYKENRLSKKSAEFLMCAFNNISPSFMLNYVFTSVYGPYIHITSGSKCTLFIILFISSLFGASIVHILYPNQISPYKSDTDNNITSSKKNSKSIIQLLDTCIFSSFEVQVKIGGYIILFTIISALFQHTLSLPPLACATFTSIIELTSGLQSFYINQLHYATHIIIPTISALTTFGGLCTIMQVKTVLDNSDLSITKYLISKILAAAFSFIITYLLI